MSDTTSPSVVDVDEDAAKRFALLEIDDKPAKSAVPETDPAGFEVVKPAPVVRGQTVDAEGAARATADAKFLTEQGFSLAPTVYAVGTMVVQAGIDNFKQSRQEWDKMPLAGDALNSLATQVRKENRQDHLVDATQLVMTPAGEIHTTGNGTYPITERGFDSLCFFTTPGGAGYLSQCPVNLRAENLNYWLPRAERLDKRASKKAGQDIMVPRQVTLRTREMLGRQEIFAVTGPRYGKFDIDQVAEEISKGLTGDARADIIYDGYKARINVIFHSNLQPESAVAGEVFKAGLLIRTADDGSGSIKFSAQVWRNLCVNLMVIDFKQLLVGSRRHIGTGENIAADVRAHLEATQEKIGLFVKKWDEASAENILERYSLTDPQQVFEGLVANNVLHIPGTRREDMVSRLMSCWTIEPGYSKQAFLNAITRVAHTYDWKSWETTQQLEETAGNMLFQSVWNCIPPKEPTLDDIA